MFTWYL